MRGTMKKTKKIIGILFCTILLTACQSLPEVASDTEIEIPLVEEYDAGMSKARFIAAPDKDTEGEEAKEHTSYTASYMMYVKDTEANFVLGDRDGEYGQLVLCGIRESADEDCFILRVFENGTEVEDPSFHHEVQISNDNYQAFDVKLEVMSNSENTDKDIKDDAQTSILTVVINDENVGSFAVPTYSLGCVGTYKQRGVSTAGLDDILVLEGDEVLFNETFDGVYTNNLYEYSYDPEQIHDNAFEPNKFKTFYDTKGRSLKVTSGFILSDTRKEGAPVFRKNFDVEKKDIESAYIYLTALGSFDIELNGRKVTENFFEPGKMVYGNYLNYVSYDVTELISDNNEMMIYLFHGFFDRGIGYPETRNLWGSGPALKGELVVNYSDGQQVIIPTDDSFVVTRDSRYRYDDVYHGEMIDDRYDITADAKWENAVVIERNSANESIFDAEILHKENESIAATGEIHPVSVSEIDDDCYVYDFGVNMAGTLSVLLDTKEIADLAEGHVLTFRYGEITNCEEMVNPDGENGTVWTQNLYTARNTDQYILGDKSIYEGDGKEICFSHTYHGFRYVEITGLPKSLPLDSIKALTLSSDMEETGEFTSANETVNLFFQNSSRSLSSNIMDAPTDCPQRDERLSWTGDAQAVSAFAMYRYDAEAFYKNYLRAIRCQQAENGFVNDVTYIRSSGYGGHSCWGDAIVTITWNHYLQYGDISILEENVDAACLWVDYLESIAQDDLVNTGGYGDHLSQQGTDVTLSDTAWSAHSARLVSKICDKLGDKERADRYAAIADRFTDKWQKTYIRSDPSAEAGILIDEYESETAYALGIEFSLFPEEMKADAAARLKILTEYGGYLFYPGYSGMEFYLPALCDYGYGDTAVMVLTCTQPGGLVHPLSMGLTTNPEELSCFRYEDYTGENYAGGKYLVTGSLNHAAYSSVCEVYFRNILGIKTDENAPGYEHFYIQPCVTELLGEVNGSHKCRFGEIKVSWNAAEHKLTCTIPVGTTCTVILPDGTATEVKSGDHEFTWQ